jgi:hypothetical protein
MFTHSNTHVHKETCKTFSFTANFEERKKLFYPFVYILSKEGNNGEKKVISRKKNSPKFKDKVNESSNSEEEATLSNSSVMN